MMQNENWYFDNITEDIIQGDMNDSGSWLYMCRKLKANAIIRKYGNDMKAKLHSLPPLLVEAILNYRYNKQNQGAKWNEI